MRIRITSVRTATATLAVGCSLFAVSGPMTATALSDPINHGGPDKESAQCTALWNSFESNVNTSNLAGAKQNLSDATAAGCEWATSRLLPSTGGIVAPRGPGILAR